jgi:hypothetical protein
LPIYRKNQPPSAWWVSRKLSTQPHRVPLRNSAIGTLPLTLDNV